MAESSAHAEPIESEIEAAAGERPNVFSASNGPVLVVTVQFSEVPSLPVPSLETIVRAAVAREFKKEPTTLTISFVYQKQWPFDRKAGTPVCRGWRNSSPSRPIGATWTWHAETLRLPPLSTARSGISSTATGRRRSRSSFRSPRLAYAAE